MAACTVWYGYGKAFQQFFCALFVADGFNCCIACIPRNGSFNMFLVFAIAELDQGVVVEPEPWDPPFRCGIDDALCRWSQFVVLINLLQYINIFLQIIWFTFY